jgi:hypothetical protein
LNLAIFFLSVDLLGRNQRGPKGIFRIPLEPFRDLPETPSHNCPQKVRVFVVGFTRYGRENNQSKILFYSQSVKEKMAEIVARYRPFCPHYCIDGSHMKAF